MKCANITLLYYFFLSVIPLNGVTVQFMQHTLRLNMDRCFLIDKIVTYFCLCRDSFFFCVCVCVFWISSWRNPVIQLLQYFLTLLQEHICYCNAHYSCHTQIELWKIASMNQNNHSLSFLIMLSVTLHLWNISAISLNTVVQDKVKLRPTFDINKAKCYNWQGNG